MPKHLIKLFALSLAFGNCFILAAQSVPRTASRSAALPPGTIDGAKNPELISDFKAWEVFFNSVAVPESATEFKKWEAKDKFRRAHLGEDDTAEVMPHDPPLCDPFQGIHGLGMLGEITRHGVCQLRFAPPRSDRFIQGVLHISLTIIL